MKTNRLISAISWRIIEMYLEGNFQINPPLQAIHFAYLERFGRIRHVKRDVALLEKWRDPLREAVGLPLGLEGAYYVAVDIYDDKDSTVLEYNEPPQEQPRLWCSWEPSADGKFYVWIDGDKNYAYDAWLDYVIAHFFNPWHYKLSGKIECFEYYNKYFPPNDEGEEEIAMRYVEKSELIIKDDNIVIENFLGTFKDE
jgi:hypothetical protein